MRAGDAGLNFFGFFTPSKDRSTHTALSPSHNSTIHSGLKPFSFGWEDPIDTNAETDAMIYIMSHEAKMFQFNKIHLSNARSWQKYAKDFSVNNDVYGTFFAAWISLVILSRDVMSQRNTKGKQPKGDNEPIEWCFGVFKEKIFEVVRAPELKDCRSKLAERHDGKILRDQNRKNGTKQALDKLAQIWANEYKFDLDSEIMGVRTLLIEVRNGLFHGGKLYNDDSLNRENDDKTLLANLNPILLAIIDELLDSEQLTQESNYQFGQ